MFKVTQVVFFIMGALTIVEIINVHKGFQIITQNLLMKSKRKLLWTSSCTTFFLSSVLDNLTTTIAMLSLLKKLVPDRNDRLVLGGATVIAANVGGVWTPIGDVSTTLLWIYGQVTTLPLLRDLLLPSIVGLSATLYWIGRHFKGTLNTQHASETIEPGGALVLLIGVGSLIFVPFFRLITDLPPFMGMLFGLAIMWITTDLLHCKSEERNHLRVTSILPKVDISIVLFYLGILLSVNALESSGLLRTFSAWLNIHVSEYLLIPILIGLASSVVDNVSLVAATIGMYGLEAFPPDSVFWQTISYCAGTGGSIFIIGSAAGVAFMALEKADFMWYLKKMTIPALITFFTGLIAYFAQNAISLFL